MKKRQPQLQLNTLAVALAFALPAMSYASDQSDSAGFVEGSSLNILNRNVFWNQTHTDSHTRDWSQALMATFSSGFTQGTLHDINMAARYCDHLVALHSGRMLLQGPPAQLMNSEVLAAIYGIRMGVLPHPGNGSAVSFHY